MEGNEQPKSGSRVWTTAVSCALLAIACALMFLLHPGYEADTGAMSDRPEFAYLSYGLWWCAGGLLCIAGWIATFIGLGLLAMRRIRPGASMWLALVGGLCAAGLLGYALAVFERIANP